MRPFPAIWKLQHDEDVVRSTMMSPDASASRPAQVPGRGRGRLESPVSPILSEIAGGPRVTAVRLEASEEMANIALIASQAD